MFYVSSFIACVIPCRKFIVQNMCNEKIANLTENDYVGLSLRTAKELLSILIEEDEPNIWPQQCNKVLSDTGFYNNSCCYNNNCSRHLFQMRFILIIFIVCNLKFPLKK